MWWPLLLACAPNAPPALSRPNALALAPDGSVIVSDFGHDRLVVFGPDGTFERTFGGPGIGVDQLWRVYALATDTDGSLLVVNRRPANAADAQGDTWEIKRFVDGREAQVMPFRGHFSSPSHTMQALAVRPDGRLLVANPGGGELFELDREGRVIGSVGGAPSPDAAPYALAADGDSVWVAEQRSHRVVRLGPDGAGEALSTDDAGHGPLRFPSAVAVCPGSWIAVADLGNHRVQRYDLEGRWLGGFEPERAGPDQPVQLLALAVSPGCDRLYVADSKGDRVLVTDIDGVVERELHGWSAR